MPLHIYVEHNNNIELERGLLGTCCEGILQGHDV